MNSLRVLADGAGHRQVASIAIPMIASAITVPLLGLVDTYVMGHLSCSIYLAAVALGSMAVSLIYWLAGFIRMSTTGLVAQSHGAQDSQSALDHLLRSLFISVVISSLLLLLMNPLVQLVLWLANPSQEVAMGVQQYMTIRLLSAPAALANLALSGYLLGKQRAKAVMALLLLTNSTNIVLDLLFVLGLDMGVAGVAWATVAADYLALGYALWCVSSLAFGQRLRQWRSVLFPWSRLMAVVRLNRDIFIRAALLQSCFAFITAQGARLGDDVLAANAVLLNFLLLSSYGLDGIAHAAESLFGEAIGRRSRQKMRNVLLLTLSWTVMFALILTGFFVIAGEWMVFQLTDIRLVRQMAVEFLPLVAWLPLLACLGFLLDGIFIGAMWGRAMRNCMTVAVLGVFFPVWWLWQEQGNAALWYAMLSFMAARGLLQSAWFWYRWRYGIGLTASVQPE